MFRTSNARGLKRFNKIRSLDCRRVSKLTLTSKQLLIIENASILTLGEKIELLLVALGNKLTTELYMNIQYQWTGKIKQGLARQEDLNQLRHLLKQLPFVYFIDSLPKKNRQDGRVQKFTWFQVSLNRSVSEFMKSFPDDLTEFEEGVLYGYPLSAIRAFSGLTEARYDKPSAASCFLSGGVCSVDFWEEEQRYYELWWKKLKKLSPKIVEEAEVKFKSMQSHPSRPINLE